MHKKMEPEIKDYETLLNEIKERKIEEMRKTLLPKKDSFRQSSGRDNLVIGAGSSFRGDGMLSNSKFNEVSSYSKGSIVSSGIMRIGGLARRRQSKIHAEQTNEFKRIQNSIQQQSFMEQVAEEARQLEEQQAAELARLEAEKIRLSQ